MERSVYAGQTIYVATIHHKERVIRIPFSRRLGAEVVGWREFDTDSIGTFSGEVERPGTPREMAIRKAIEAAKANPNGCGVGSEGSVGSDPAVPFLTSNEEILAFVDKPRGITVVESLVHYRPVYDSVVVTAGDSLDEFLQKVKFGSHGVVVAADLESGGAVFGKFLGGRSRTMKTVKGLRDCDQLKAARRELHTLARDGLVRISSDFRAHQNPTRMRVIGRVARRLAQRLSVRCPGCGAPGFGIVGWEAGLPCKGCGSPSKVASHARYGCSVCSFEELRARPDGREGVDPSECEFCNP